LGKKDKKKKKSKEEKELLKKDKIAKKGLKSKCCESYKKGEDKRCKRCPRFDLPKE
jgi:hypothetical protein